MPVPYKKNKIRKVKCKSCGKGFETGITKQKFCSKECQQKVPPTGNPKGRPTKYRASYCKQLITWMGKGLSFESFAGDVDVDRDTVYEWAKAHEEFADAKRKGSAKSQAFWEKMGVAGSSGQLPNFKTGAWVFNMKNRFSWRDKQEVAVTGDLTPWSSIEADDEDEDE